MRRLSLKILFWDIDGTLLKTAKAGLFAFEQATSDIFKTSIDFKSIPTAGMTDYYIAKQIIYQITGREPLPEETTTLLKHYEKILPAHLAARQGHLTPAVQEILNYFRHRSNCLSLLLTGNTYLGAKAKLTRYDIINYFDFSLSAFGDTCDNRLDLADQALAKVSNCYPDLIPQQIFVIGDTPNDIRCGKSINAKTIAVATGVYSLEELAKHSPWWALNQLPDPLTFETKLNEAL